MQHHQSGLSQLRLNSIMEYDWGSESKECLISELTHKNCKKYAELWMGTHSNGPSMLDAEKSLLQYLKQHSLSDIPFLFKVLCIQKALSIQLHPNKPQAQRLFHERKGTYPDSNQKPQMFYTLTEFQCLLGIVPEEQMDRLFQHEPFSLLETKGKRVKAIFAEICGLSQEQTRKYIELLLLNAAKVCPQRQKLIIQLQNQHPYDAGILVSCFLRYKRLGAGECYAIEAGLPHAYLRGTCLQLMKNSDNVVRLGLTPKLKDIPTLLEIIKDDVGIDAIRVDPLPTETAQLKCLTPPAYGAEPSITIYRWQGLILTEVIHETSTDLTLEVPASSIGIIMNGQLRALGGSLMLQKGGILFFHPGKHLLMGPFRLFTGSYF